MPFKFPPSSLFAISEHRAVAISAAAEVLRLFHLFTPSVVWLMVASAENKFVSIVSLPEIALRTSRTVGSAPFGASP